MANEATVNSLLQITKGNLQYASRPTAFRVDVENVGGPTPGAILVTPTGVDVDLSVLISPGLCRIANYDTTNYLEYGIWDPDNDRFFPLGEVGPGETYVIKLSRNLSSEFGTGVGTGTVGEAVNSLRLRSYNDDVIALVEAFDR